MARDDRPVAYESESLSETFDCIRGDIHLYEIGEITYETLLAGLRESVEVLAGKATREVGGR